MKLPPTTQSNTGAADVIVLSGAFLSLCAGPPAHNEISFGME